MPLYHAHPVGNGIRTDHPIPDLPFVDDSHLPLDDRFALEAVGRDRGAEDMWGRTDDVIRGEGWVAFTTDPRRPELGWLVRWHPEHGWSVVLYRDKEVADAYMSYNGAALLFRSGGYWWDGQTWYRPSQVFVWADGDFQDRPVPAAVTVTVDQLVDPAKARPDQATVLTVEEVNLDAPPPSRWLNDLGAWAARRKPEDRPLTGCVVELAAAELAAERLVGVPGLAELAGIAPATLRAYISREEAEVPRPQTVLNGRDMWSRPVAEEWAQARLRSDEGLEAAVATKHSEVSMPPGLAEICGWLTRLFTAALWERRDRRKRWALRWRNQAAVVQVAEDLAWTAAVGVRQHVPMDDLAATIRHAARDDFTFCRSRAGEHGMDIVALSLPVQRMLDWLIRHDPPLAAATIGEIISAAIELGYSQKTAEFAIRSGLATGKLNAQARNDFLDRVFAPDTPTSGR